MVDERRRDRARRSFRQRLEQGDTYGLLLILLIGAYVEVAVVGGSLWGQVFLALTFSAVLLLTLHTSHVRGRWIRIASAITILVVCLTLTQAIIGDETVTGTTYIWIGLIVASPVVILSRIFRHPTVDVETILGAICSYLLIGISFAAIYAMLQATGSENFFAQHDAATRINFLYFSFVVLTTLGFGDLTPATSVGKVLVTLEALMGQIFLVTVVALLVANFAGSRRREEDEQARAPKDAAADG